MNLSDILLIALIGIPALFLIPYLITLGISHGWREGKDDK